MASKQMCPLHIETTGCLEIEVENGLEPAPAQTCLERLLLRKTELRLPRWARLPRIQQSHALLISGEGGGSFRLRGYTATIQDMIVCLIFYYLK